MYNDTPPIKYEPIKNYNWNHILVPVIIFIISTGIVLFLTMLVNNEEYPFDSGYYYSLSESFFSSGKFSIENYPASYRGIIFPLLLSLFNKIARIFHGSGLFGWRYLISLFSGLFLLSFPSIFGMTGKRKISPIPLLLLIIVWRGLFFVPLSDLIAAYFLIFALACINKAYFRIYNKSFGFFELLLFCLSGIFFYAAYNTRTIYLFTLPFILLIIFLNKNIGKIKSIIIISTICIGIIVLGSFQIVSNKKTYNKYSLFVQTQIGFGTSLFVNQLFEGIDIDLYETYMSGGPDFYAYKYTDNSGKQVIETENVSTRNYKNYIKILCKYPFEMLSIFFRHFFVMLNPVDGGGYVYSHNVKTRFILTLLNYSMLFMVVIFLKREVFEPMLIKRNKIEDIKIQIEKEYQGKIIPFLSIMTLIVPFIAIIPGMVEERFALPFWLIVYGFIAYKIDFKKEFLYYKQKPILHLVLYLIGFMFYIIILTSIYANNPEGKLIPILSISIFK